MNTLIFWVVMVVIFTSTTHLCMTVLKRDNTFTDALLIGTVLATSILGVAAMLTHITTH